ncbi:sulfotransferase [uncultured Psychroserpens sp.]|uniref:sulfotransferase family protein n=1 Tax=uncultured Psychroserpens sp. TaxID=255436 RepID=UPI00260C76DC|nr:sulfotransferase [uncultured Psychroserpens sp.]
MTVNFLLIGSAKSATTSLSNGISQHPDICFCNQKEPQFFSKENWKEHLHEYHSLFKKTAKLYGEASTNYSKFPHYNQNIHKDIFNYNPNMKIIYIMRHPLDRMISHYIHSFNRGHEPLKDINEAISSNIHYINTGKYAMQIEPYIKHFGRKNVLLLFFEDFIINPQSVLNTVFNFLNIEPIVIDNKFLNTNKSFDKSIIHHKYDNPKTLTKKVKKVLLIIKNTVFSSDMINKKPQLDEQTKSYVLENIKSDVKKIETLTNRDLSHWLI